MRSVVLILSFFMQTFLPLQAELSRTAQNYNDNLRRTFHKYGLSLDHKEQAFKEKYLVYEDSTFRSPTFQQDFALPLLMSNDGDAMRLATQAIAEVGISSLYIPVTEDAVVDDKKFKQCRNLHRTIHNMKKEIVMLNTAYYTYELFKEDVTKIITELEENPQYVQFAEEARKLIDKTEFQIKETQGRLEETKDKKNDPMIKLPSLFFKIYFSYAVIRIVGSKWQRTDKFLKSFNDFLTGRKIRVNLRKKLPAQTRKSQLKIRNAFSKFKKSTWTRAGGIFLGLGTIFIDFFMLENEMDQLIQQIDILGTRMDKLSEIVEYLQMKDEIEYSIKDNLDRLRTKVDHLQYGVADPLLIATEIDLTQEHAQFKLVCRFKPSEDFSQVKLISTPGMCSEPK